MSQKPFNLETAAIFISAALIREYGKYIKFRIWIFNTQEVHNGGVYTKVTHPPASTLTGGDIRMLVGEFLEIFSWPSNSKDQPFYVRHRRNLPKDKGKVFEALAEGGYVYVCETVDKKAARHAAQAFRRCHESHILS